MIDRPNSLATDGSCIHIGLVNNMPDSSLDATERQFRTLLCEAAEGIPLHFSLFAIPEVPRSDRAKLRISTCYSSISDVWEDRLDGLIVTGAEPLASNLEDEPYWTSLVQLIDWAEHNTHSAIWSCLAAHAAVLHLHGIKRRRFSDKLFGVFECEKISDHLLTAGIPPNFRTPHSRWNNIPEDGLSACGYGILTRLKDGAVDAFVKQENSLFVFLQGHLEYEAASLLLEYRRDIQRFFSGQRAFYPPMPHGCFDEDTTVACALLRERALSDRSYQSFADFPAIQVRNTWRSEAVRFYRNWLDHLGDQKSKSLRSRPRRTEYNFKTALTTAPYLAPEGEAG
jgi:homoserine O-succinyltransferase/O-acetyltransferase